MDQQTNGTNELLNSVTKFNAETLNSRQRKKKEINDSNYSNEVALYNNSIDTSNQGISDDCTYNLRKIQVADGIKHKFPNFDWSSDYWKSPENVIQSYLDTNPDSEDPIYSYVMDKGNENCDPSGLYATMGWYEPEEASVGWNMLGGALETLQGPGELIEKGIDSVVGSIWKLFTKDDAKVDKWLQKQEDFRNKYSNLPGTDPESDAYQYTNLATDFVMTILTSLIPGVGEAKWANLALKYPKFAKLIKAEGGIEKFIKTVVKGGFNGVKFEALNNAFDGELLSGDEALWGALFGAGGDLLFNIKPIKSMATWLQTNGVMTQGKLENIVRRIKDKVGTEPTSDDVANFITKNGLTGSRRSIRKKSEKLYKESKGMVDSLLEKSTSVRPSREADEAIELLIKRIENSSDPKVPLEDTLASLRELQSKGGSYTASDLEKIKRHIDDLLDIYRDDATAKASYKSWAELRKRIQTQIEDIATEEGLGNIEMLNNTTQIAYGIMKGAEEKTLLNVASESAAKFGIPSLALYGVVEDVWNGDWDSALKKTAIISVTNNTFIRSHLGSLMNRLSGTNRAELSRWLTSKGKEALSESATNTLMDIVKNDKVSYTYIKNLLKSFIREGIEFGKDFTTNSIKGGAVLGGNDLREMYFE